jgi:adenylosuccinate synthase
VGAIIIVDAFWGDAGKGKFAAHLTMTENAAICVRAGIGPNAGHSVYRNDKQIKTRLIPLGFLNPKARVMIGSGVAVDPEILLDEVKQTGTQNRLWVDYRCPVIEPIHKRRERRDRVMIAIDSTKSGSGAARADYVMRRARRVADVTQLSPYAGDVAEACNRAASTGKIVVEGSQATFLSLYLSDRYPYTSSDNCTSAAFIDDVGLNWRLVERVVLLVKCLPTAVGEGPLPHEMTPEEIHRRGLREFGTNTGRERRRSSRIDMRLLRYSTMVNGPTEIALTWCDQFDNAIAGRTTRSAITPRIRRLIAQVEKASGVPVSYLETGKELSHMIKLS